MSFEPEIKPENEGQYIREIKHRAFTANRKREIQDEKFSK